MKLIHELFQDYATGTDASNIAIETNKEKISYAALNMQSNRLAVQLTAVGARAERIVAICFDGKSRDYNTAIIEVIICMLAVIKTGAAFLPLDIGNFDNHKDRIQKIVQECINLNSSPLVAVINGDKIVRDLSFTDLTNINFQYNSFYNTSARPLMNHRVDVALNNLAYVIYTSGSTGQPKGVLIEHAGLANCVDVHINELQLNASQKVLQYASPNFDAFIIEVFMTLCSGAILVLSSNREDLSIDLEEHQVTTAIFIPALLSILDPKKFPTLKTIVATGQITTEDLITKWRYLPDNITLRNMYNGYGLTESTICATLAKVPQNFASSDNGVISIGNPINGCTILILNEDQQPVPPGTKGEMYITGINVGRGYVDQEATRKTFLDIPHDLLTLVGVHSAKNGKMIKTNDFGEMQSDGQIICYGRQSRECKQDGKLVNLDVLQNLINKHELVEKSAAVWLEENKQLIAYYKLFFPLLSPSIDFRTSLRKQLLNFLNGIKPNLFIQLSHIPLTDSGKINYKQLPPPTIELVTQGHPYKAPRSQLEKQIQLIWSNILGYDANTISIDFDFEELGGTSIHIIQLYNQLSELCNQHNIYITKENLEEASTISAQANWIRFLKYGRNLILLQAPDDIDSILFCLPEITDTVDFAKLLKLKDSPDSFPNTQIYALHSIQNVEDPFAYNCLEEIVDYFSTLIISAIESDVKIYFIGYSFGAFLANEILKKLHHLKVTENVEDNIHAFFLDFPAPDYLSSPRAHGEYLYNTFCHLELYLNNFTSSGNKNSAESTLAKFKSDTHFEFFLNMDPRDQIDFIFNNYVASFPEKTHTILNSIKVLLLASTESFSKQPVKLPYSATLFCSKEFFSDSNTTDQKKQAWDAHFVVPDDTIFVGGTHLDLIKETESKEKWFKHIHQYINPAVVLSSQSSDLNTPQSSGTENSMAIAQLCHPENVSIAPTRIDNFITSLADIIPDEKKETFEKLVFILRSSSPINAVESDKKHDTNKRRRSSSDLSPSLFAAKRISQSDPTRDNSKGRITRVPSNTGQSRSADELLKLANADKDNLSLDNQATGNNENNNNTNVPSTIGYYSPPSHNKF